MLMPTRLTASTVTGLIRVLGVPACRAETVHLPDSTPRVRHLFRLTLMTQMTLLAVRPLLPTSLRRAAMVLTVAIAIGFIVNSARVALLGVVASRVPSEFGYWEQYVAGSVLFPVGATCSRASVEVRPHTVSPDPATKWARIDCNQPMWLAVMTRPRGLSQHCGRSNLPVR
jgi:exosortase/archaeosortase family protein